MLQSTKAFLKKATLGKLFRAFKSQSNRCLLPLLAGSFLLQTGCQTKKELNTAKICLVSDPETLSSQTATSIPLLTVIRHLSEGLVRITPQGLLEPALAESITVSEDGLRYHIILRKEALWSKNQAVVAQDFDRSYKQILTGQVQSKMADQLFAIKNGKAIYQKKVPEDALGLHILSDREFEIELEQASPAFMYQLSTPLFFPVPQVYEPAQTSMVSCGAYYLSEWQHQKQLVLRKNPYYWDAKNIRIDQIDCLILPDDNTQFIMFGEGSLDFCGSPMGMLPVESVHDQEIQPYLKRFSEPTTNMLVFNTRNGPFSHLKMRSAFSLGIDRECLIKEELYTGSPATSFVPPQIMGESLSYFSEYDPVKARSLFKEALVEMNMKLEELPVLRLLYLARGPHGKRAQAIEDNWYKLFGIHVQLIGLEWSLHNSSLLAGDFDIATASWVADFPDASNFLQIYYDVHGGRNYPGWQNTQYQHEFDLGLAAADLNERRNYFLKAEQILMNNMVIAPVAFPASPYVCSSRLKNIYCNPMGYVDFRWAYIED